MVWRAVVALGALLVSVIASEGLLRLFDVGTSEALFTVNEQEYFDVPGLFEPEQSLTEAAGTRFEHRTTINALGYRGAGFPLRKPPGEYRVLMVGDSFTWGHNVDDAATLPASLERVGRIACSRVRIINAGVSGLTIFGEDSMAIRGLRTDPDLVVLVAHENDIDELAESRLWAGLAENRRRKSRPPMSWAYRVVRRSAVWNTLLMVKRARSHQIPQRAGGGEAGASPDDRIVRDARQEYAQRLAGLRDTLGKAGIPLAVVLYPHPASVSRGEATANQRSVGAASRSLGIHTLDLLDTLKQSARALEALFLLPEDYHPSPIGHEVSARFLAGHLWDEPRTGGDGATSGSRRPCDEGQ